MPALSAPLARTLAGRALADRSLSHGNDDTQPVERQSIDSWLAFNRQLQWSP
jgi:hypothetical protein